ncbi:39S ribosomal protein L21, mitochondrial isoform X2 [Hypomesus transpacificus]|uniref:39S ribosomal protein L21, mitochondrial isoform X2 n=1 Tax=Hypomesus transpacificus TaxID=137520 RepID=UPI001F07738E|nr:39S ribosomal protein L21, mitochondrial isoform X2 [Hypomesus transpacificus]
MAVTLRGGCVQLLRTCRSLQSQHVHVPIINQIGVQFPALIRHCSSQSVKLPSSSGPETSLSRPPWPELTPIDPEEQRQQHAAVVQKVNGVLAQGDLGRLFAVVHFASRQWKVTNEDLILIENHIEAECGDRIRMEKVLMVGGEDFTMIGRPLLGRNLVRVEATVLEKTESWPKVHMRFWKRHRFQKKKIIIQPQTILRINSIEVAPMLS